MLSRVLSRTISLIMGTGGQVHFKGQTHSSFGEWKQSHFYSIIVICWLRLGGWVVVEIFLARMG